MAYANKQDQRDSWNRWYERNRNRQIERVAKRKEALKKWLQTYKATLKCNRCPEDHPACLQFHHTDPKEKDLALSDAMKNGWSVERLEKEISKCEVLCANCHFKEHSGLV